MVKVEKIALKAFYSEFRNGCLGLYLTEPKKIKGKRKILMMGKTNTRYSQLDVYLNRASINLPENTLCSLDPHFARKFFYFSLFEPIAFSVR